MLVGLGRFRSNIKIELKFSELLGLGWDGFIKKTYPKGVSLVRFIPGGSWVRSSNPFLGAGIMTILNGIPIARPITQLTSRKP